MDDIVLEKMGVTPEGEPDLKAWNAFLDRIAAADKEIKIGLVGKYVELQDAYKSINESLFQAATYCGRKLKLTYIHSEKLTPEDVEEKLRPMDGIIIAPGFGQRGIEGKFVALKWCREHNIPTFGICLGMQCMVIEFARDVLGLADANSTEMDPKTPHNVIDLMEEQKSISNLGGTMRLGAYDCVLAPDSKAAEAYGATSVSERHRHRFEFNDDFRTQFESAGKPRVAPRGGGGDPHPRLVRGHTIPP
jgi:CTP synthase